MENGVRGSNGDWEKRVKSYRNFKKKKADVCKHPL